MIPVTDPDLSPASQGRTLPAPLHAVNESLAFLLELLMLGALAWWGYHAVHALAARIVLMMAIPALAAVIWACSQRRGHGSGSPWPACSPSSARSPSS